MAKPKRRVAAVKTSKPELELRERRRLLDQIRRARKTHQALVREKSRLQISIAKADAQLEALGLVLRERFAFAPTPQGTAAIEEARQRA